MRKIKSLITILLVSILMMGYATFFSNEAKAYDESIAANILRVAQSPYEFNANELLVVYAENSTGHPTMLNNRASAAKEGLIPILQYDDCTTTDAVAVESDCAWSDGVINASDASNVLVISRVGGKYDSEDTVEREQRYFNYGVNRLRFSVADALEVDRDSVHITVCVRTYALAAYDVEEDIIELTDEEGITAERLAEIQAAASENERVAEEVGETGTDIGMQEVAEAAGVTAGDVVMQFVSVEAVTEDNRTFRLLVADDNKFYFEEKQDVPEIETPDFETVLEYSSEVEGKMSEDGTTYLPAYTENDVNKKDLDVTATIKSKTNEEIVSTNGVEMKADGSANSEGWYYPDVDNKKVIAKVYAFDTYDNTKANGEVSETVALVGSEGGESTEKPHVKWTFRRKVKEETENDDGSVKIVITYNLPVDKTSIPSDWEPIYDEDGETIHKITKTIKKGENYKKDVVVKQNGSDEKVTTTVEKVWTLPKTGDIWTLAAVIAIILTAFTITRYRKIKIK